MTDKPKGITTITPERNRYTPQGTHGKVTVYKLSEMSAEEIEKHGLAKYVTQHDD